MDPNDVLFMSAPRVLFWPFVLTIVFSRPIAGDFHSTTPTSLDTKGSLAVDKVCDEMVVTGPDVLIEVLRENRGAALSTRLPDIYDVESRSRILADRGDADCDIGKEWRK